ncbi:hypothetical protein SAMN05192540_1527 [Maribacter dokdonensis]|uniref:Uncharacterized protein n=1 Tax=Maribacter dokdonensis TaxID=320912 RepID=A0A1H4M5S7_9FLAO|nr:hypothetical protein [Maribacter dokdonensis]SEB78157.1 hypothetical protein SAMN05192540_1527 [Maribacter dokdonensis]
MVHLIDKLKSERELLLSQQNIQTALLLYVYEKPIEFVLGGIEQIALRGYKGEKLTGDEIGVLINTPNKKNKLDNNIFKLVGLYLVCNQNNDLKELLVDKFDAGTSFEQFMLFKILPEIFEQKINEVSKNSGSPLVRFLLKEKVEEEELKDSLGSLLLSSFGVTELIVLEDFLRTEMQITYQNLTSIELVRQVLNNFPEAIKKIKQRRKGKNVFKFHDEYDVQDILYVMLKPLFPNMKEEDPIPKVGSSSTKIDLILREEKILIEVKMMKESDSDEGKFIKQLKEDIQSYHACQWLEDLVCFVYDPFDKTKDRTNFYDLNGRQTIKDKSFNVEVIVLK